MSAKTPASSPKRIQRLSEMQFLKGSEVELTLMEFRRRPGDIIAQVQLGRTFRLTKNGRVVAVLTAPEPTAFELGATVRRLGLSNG